MNFVLAWLQSLGLGTISQSVLIEAAIAGGLAIAALFNELIPPAFPVGKTGGVGQRIQRIMSPRLEALLRPICRLRVGRKPDNFLFRRGGWPRGFRGRRD